jgi:ribosomal protein S18 acetylase RimI-like enzyme
MTYTIRPAAKNDLTDICSLCIKSANIYLDLKVLTKGQFTDFFNLTVTRQRMFDDFENISCSVAVDENDKIIGFCKCNAISADNIKLLNEYFKMDPPDSQQTLHIQSIYIDPDNKHHGIGHALMKIEAEKAIANGFRYGFTTVLTGNTSPEFFKKLGATHIGSFVQNPFTGEIANDNKPKSQYFLSQEAYNFNSLESILELKPSISKDSKTGLNQK